MAESKKKSTGDTARYYQGPTATPKWSEDKRAKFKQRFLQILQDDQYVMSPEGGNQLREVLLKARQSGLVQQDFINNFEKYRATRYQEIAAAPLVDSITGEALTKTAPGPRQLNPQTQKYEPGPVRTVPMRGADLALGGGLYIGAQPQEVQAKRGEILQQQATQTEADVARYKAVQGALASPLRNIAAGLLGTGKGVADAGRTVAAGIPGIGEVVTPPSVEELKRKYTVRPLDQMTPESVLQDQQQAGRLAGYEFGRQGTALIGGVVGSNIGAGAAALASIAAPAAAPILSPLLVAGGSLAGGVGGNIAQDAIMARAYGPEKWKQVREVFAQSNQEAPGAKFAADLAATLVQGSPVLASGIGMRRTGGLLSAAVRGETVGLTGSLKQLGVGARKIENAVDAANTVRIVGQGGPFSKYDMMVSSALKKFKAAPNDVEDSIKMFAPDAPTLAGRVRQLGEFVQSTPAANTFVADAIGEQGVNLAFATTKYLKNLSDYNNDTTGMVEPPSTFEALAELAFGSLFIGNNKFTDGVTAVQNFVSGGISKGLEKIPGVGGYVEAGRKRIEGSQDAIVRRFLGQDVLRQVRGAKPADLAELGTRARLSNLTPDQLPRLDANERVVSLANGRAVIFNPALGTSREVDYADVMPTVDDTANVVANSQAIDSVKKIPTVKTGNIIERRFGFGGQQGYEVIPQEGPVKQQVVGLSAINGQGHIVIREIPDVVQDGKAKRGAQPEYSVVRLSDIDQPNNRNIAELMLKEAGLKPSDVRVEMPQIAPLLFVEQEQIRLIDNDLKGFKAAKDAVGSITKFFPTTITLDNNIPVSGRIVSVADNGDVVVQLMSSQDIFVRVDPVNIRKGVSEPLPPIALRDIFGSIDQSAMGVARWESSFNAVENPESPFHTDSQIGLPVLLSGEEADRISVLRTAYRNAANAEAGRKVLSQISSKVFGKDAKAAKNDYVVGSVINVINHQGNEELGVVMTNTWLGPVVYLDSLSGRPIVVQEPNIVKGESKPKTKKDVTAEGEQEAEPRTAADFISQASGKKPEGGAVKQKSTKGKTVRADVAARQMAILIGSSNETRIMSGENQIDLIIPGKTKNINKAQRLVNRAAMDPDSLTEEDKAIAQALQMPDFGNRDWYRRTHQQVSYINNSVVKDAVDALIAPMADDPEYLSGKNPIPLDTLPEVKRKAMFDAGFASSPDKDATVDRASLAAIARQPLGVVVSTLTQMGDSDTSSDQADLGTDTLNSIVRQIRLGGTTYQLDMTRRIVDRESFENELRRLIGNVQRQPRSLSSVLSRKVTGSADFMDAIADKNYVAALSQLEDEMEGDLDSEDAEIDLDNVLSELFDTIDLSDPNAWLSAFRLPLKSLNGGSLEGQYQDINWNLLSTLAASGVYETTGQIEQAIQDELNVEAIRDEVLLNGALESGDAFDLDAATESLKNIPADHVLKDSIPNDTWKNLQVTVENALLRDDNTKKLHRALLQGQGRFSGDRPWRFVTTEDLDAALKDGNLKRLRRLLRLKIREIDYRSNILLVNGKPADNRKRVEYRQQNWDGLQEYIKAVAVDIPAKQAPAKPAKAKASKPKPKTEVVKETTVEVSPTPDVQTGVLQAMASAQALDRKDINQWTDGEFQRIQEYIDVIAQLTNVDFATVTDEIKDDYEVKLFGHMKEFVSNKLIDPRLFFDLLESWAFSDKTPETLVNLFVSMLNKDPQTATILSDALPDEEPVAEDKDWIDGTTPGMLATNKFRREILIGGGPDQSLPYLNGSFLFMYDTPKQDENGNTTQPAQIMVVTTNQGKREIVIPWTRLPDEMGSFVEKDGKQIFAIPPDVIDLYISEAANIVVEELKKNPQGLFKGTLKRLTESQEDNFRQLRGLPPRKTVASNNVNTAADAAVATTPVETNPASEPKAKGQKADTEEAKKESKKDTGVFVRDENGEVVLDNDGNPIQGKKKTTLWYPFPSIEQFEVAGFTPEQVKVIRDLYDVELHRFKIMQLIQKIWQGGIWDGKEWVTVTQEIFPAADLVLGQGFINKKRRKRSTAAVFIPEREALPIERGEASHPAYELADINNTIYKLERDARILEKLYKYIGIQRKKVGFPEEFQPGEEYYPARSKDNPGGLSTPGRFKRADWKVVEPVNAIDNPPQFALEGKQFGNTYISLSEMVDIYGLDVDLQDAVASGNAKEVVFQAIQNKLDELNAAYPVAREKFDKILANAKVKKSVKTSYIDVVTPEFQPTVEDATAIVPPRLDSVDAIESAKALADMFDTFIHAAQSRRINIFVESVQNGYFLRSALPGEERRVSATGVRGKTKGLIFTSGMERDIQPLVDSFVRIWEQRTGDKLDMQTLFDLFNSDLEDASKPQRKLVDEILEVIAQEETTRFYAERMPVFANFGNTIPLIRNLNGAYLNIYDPAMKTSTKVLMAFGSANFTTFVEELSHAFVEALPYALKEELSASMNRSLRVPTLLNPSVVSKEFQEEFASGLMATLASKKFIGSGGRSTPRAALRPVLDAVGDILDGTYQELIKTSQASKGQSLVRMGEDGVEVKWQIPYASKRGKQPDPSVMLWDGAPIFLHDGTSGTVMGRVSTKNVGPFTKVRVKFDTRNGEEILEVFASDIKSIGSWTNGLNSQIMEVITSWIGERRSGFGVGVSTPKARQDRFALTEGGEFAGVIRNTEAFAQDYKSDRGANRLLFMFGMQHQSNVSWSSISKFLPEELVERVWNAEEMARLGREHAIDPLTAIRTNPDIAKIIEAYASAKVYENALALAKSSDPAEQRNAKKILNSVNQAGDTPFAKGVRGYLQAMAYNRQAQNAVSDLLASIASGDNRVYFDGYGQPGSRRYQLTIPEGQVAYVRSSTQEVRVHVVPVTNTGEPRQINGQDVIFVYNVNLSTGSMFLEGTKVRNEDGNLVNAAPFAERKQPILLKFPLPETTYVQSGITTTLPKTTLDKANSEVKDLLIQGGVKSTNFSPRIPHPMFWVVRGILDNGTLTGPDPTWDSYPPMNPRPMVSASFLGQSGNSLTDDAGGHPTISDLINEVFAPELSSDTLEVAGGSPSPVSTANPDKIALSMTGTQGALLSDIYLSASKDIEAGRVEEGKRKYAYILNVIESELGSAFDSIDADVNVRLTPAVNTISGPQIVLSGSVDIPKTYLSDAVLRAALVGMRTEQPNMFITASAQRNSVGIRMKDGSFVVPSITLTLNRQVNESEWLSFADGSFGFTEAQLSSDGTQLTLFQIPENVKDFGKVKTREWSEQTQLKIQEKFGDAIAKNVSGRLRLWNLGSAEHNGIGAFVEYRSVLDNVSYDDTVDPVFRSGAANERTKRRLRREVKTIWSAVAGKDVDLPSSFVFNRERMSNNERQRVATAYDQIPAEIQDPNVQRSYEALAKSVVKQLQGLGLSVRLMPEVRDADGNLNYADPYGGRNEIAVSDIVKNRRIFIRKSNFGDTGLIKDKIMNADSGLTSVDGTPLSFWDVLRAVHDAISYASNATTYGRDSDEMAFISHMWITEDPWAAWALAMETRVPNMWYGWHGRKVNPDQTDRTDAPEAFVFPRKDGLITFDMLYTGVVGIDDRLRKFDQVLIDDHKNYRGTVEWMKKNGTLPGGNEIPVQSFNGPVFQPDVEVIVNEDDSIGDEATINLAAGIVNVPPGTLPPTMVPGGTGGDGSGQPKTSKRRKYPKHDHKISTAQRVLFIANTVLRQGASGDASPILMQNWSLANLITNPQLLGRQVALMGQVFFNPNLGFQRKDGSILNARGMMGRRLSNKIMNEEIRSLPGYDIMEEAGMFLGTYKVDAAFEDLKEKRLAEGKPAPSILEVNELGYDLDVRDDSGLLQHWPGQGQSERFYTLSRDIVKMTTASNFIQHLVDLGYNPTPLYKKNENGEYILGEDGLPQPENTPFANAMRDLANLMNIMTGDVRINVDDVQDEVVMRMGKLLLFSPRWLTSRFLLNDIGRGILKGAFNLRGPQGKKFIEDLLAANGVSDAQLKRRDRRVETLNARLLWKSWLLWMAILAVVRGTNALNPQLLGVQVDNFGTRLRIGDYSFRMPGAMMMYLEVISSVSQTVQALKESKQVEGEPSLGQVVFENLNSLLMSRASPILRVATEVISGRDVFNQPSFIKDKAADVFLRQGIAPELYRLGLSKKAAEDTGIVASGQFLSGLLSTPVSKYTLWWPVRDAMETFYKQRQLDIERREALMHSLFAGGYSGIGGRINYLPEELKWQYDVNENMVRDTSPFDWRTYTVGGKAVEPPVDTYEPTMDMMEMPYDARIGAPDLFSQPIVEEGLSIPNPELESELVAI